jgi:hypothetical protein
MYMRSLFNCSKNVIVDILEVFIASLGHLSNWQREIADREFGGAETRSASKLQDRRIQIGAVRRTRSTTSSVGYRYGSLPIAEAPANRMTSAFRHDDA